MSTNDRTTQEGSGTPAPEAGASCTSWFHTEQYDGDDAAVDVTPYAADADPDTAEVVLRVSGDWGSAGVGVAPDRARRLAAALQEAADVAEQ